MKRKWTLCLLFVFTLALAVHAVPGPKLDEAARQEMFWKMAAMRLGLTDAQVVALKAEADSPVIKDLRAALHPARPGKGEAIAPEERATRMVAHITDIMTKLTADEPALIASLLKAYALLDPTQRRIIAAHLEMGPPSPAQLGSRENPADTNHDGVVDDAEKAAQVNQGHAGKPRGGHAGFGRGFRPHGPGPFQAFIPSAELRKTLADRIRNNTLDEAVLKAAFADWRTQAEAALKALPDAMAKFKASIPPERLEKMKQRREEWKKSHPQATPQEQK